MKKVFLYFIFIASLVILTTGCGKEKQVPKDLLLEALDNEVMISSFTFHSDLKFQMDILQTDKTNNGVENNANLFTSIPELYLTIDGKERIEPLEMESDMSIEAIVNDNKFYFDFPLLMKEDILYVKLPAVLANFLPHPMKEYIAIDVKERLEYSTYEETKESYHDVLRVMVNSLSQDLFRFEEGNSNSSDDNQQQVKLVTLQVEQENLQPFLKAFEKEGLNKLLEKIDTYTGAIDDQELVYNIQNINEYLVINDWKITNEINQEGYINKVTWQIDIIIRTEPKPIRIKAEYEQVRNDINAELVFNKQVPKKEQIITLTELEQMQDIGIME